MTVSALAGFRPLPTFVIPATLVLFVLFGIGPNSLLAFFACIVLVVGAFLLWRPGEAPILLFIFLNQWVQASLPLFYGNWHDLNVDQMFAHQGKHELASILSLFGLLCVASGMRAGAGAPSAFEPLAARRMVMAVPQRRWLQLFAGAWIAASVAKLLASAIPELSQLFLAIANMKWAAYFLLTYATFNRLDSNKVIWFAVFMAEFVIAIGGYFSTFKEVFLYTVIAIGASQVKLNLKRSSAVMALTACLLFFAVVWTAIKMDYRAFVRGDQAGQVITVDNQQAISKLLDLAFALDGPTMVQAVDQMIERIMYTEYFGVVLTYVPNVLPHEYGALWLDAITRPIMPRILFPDKAIIDESLLTNTYTGLGMAGMEQGTQISLGYMTDTYIDFGEIGMMPALLLVGLAIGRLYRWLVNHPNNRGMLGMALAPAALMPAAYLEVSSAKLVGGLFASVLAAWLISRFVVPRFMPWLRVDYYDRGARR